MTKSKLTSSILSSLLIGAIAMPATLSAGPNPADNSSSTTLVLDVALDAGTLSYSRADAWNTGPQRGDTYVVNGVVYPGFSIPDGDMSTFVPGPDGSVGGILVTGIYTSDAAAVESGDSPATTTSTHVFTLDNADGLITQGMEGVFPQIRALLGGVGQFSGAIGQVTEQVLGPNATGGFNLRFTFQLLRLNPQDNSGTQAAQKQRAQIQKARTARRPR